MHLHSGCSCYVHTNASTNPLCLSGGVLTLLGAHTERKRVWGGNTNKLREEKLVLLLHCTTPPQTPQSSHYIPLWCPSSDKRVPPARGNRKSSQHSIVHCPPSVPLSREGSRGCSGSNYREQTHLAWRWELIGKCVLWFLIEGFVSFWT